MQNELPGRNGCPDVVPYVPKPRKPPNPSQRIRMDHNSSQNRAEKGLPPDGRPAWVQKRDVKEKEAAERGEVTAKARKDDAKLQRSRIGFEQPPKPPPPPDASSALDEVELLMIP